MHSLTPVQIAAIEALTSGLTITAAAGAAGVHRTTIHHWCRTIPEFRETLEAVKMARIDAIRDEMNALAAPSLAILKSIIYDEAASPALRIRTALAIVKFIATPEKPIATSDKSSQPPAASRDEIHHNSSLSSPETTVESQTPRNAACPCGSKLKYKRCCGRNAPPVLSQAA